MKLTEICIRRPVLATVLSLVLVILGAFTGRQLNLRQYPQIEPPVISVKVQLEGVNPQIIENTITKVLENAFAGIEGLTVMSSRSDIGECRVNLQFSNRNPDAAANDVRDKLGRVRNKLPDGIVEPIIRKQDSEASAFLHLAFHSDRHTAQELADYAKRYIQNRLESISGVASVEVFGGGDIEMKLTLDPIKMAAFKVTGEDIAQALRKQNLEKSAGNLTTETREIAITTKANLITEDDFNNLIITENGNYFVRLKDVGTATLESIDRHNNVLFNGKTAVAIGITKQATANVVDISRDVHKYLSGTRLPTGMNLSIATDDSLFVERSINEVIETIYIASALVILVIFLFLRSWRAVIIPIVTIPLSLVGTFFLMYCLGFSINLLTLLALVLAIGLVVDDAIVMLENIYRYIEEGMKPLEAALKGSREISFAVIAMTITLAAVYAPIALAPGLTGKLFTEFAITLAGAVILSGFIALTLTPMMCGKFLLPHTTTATPSKLEKFNQRIENFFKSMEIGYEGLLSWCLSHRLIITSLALIISIGGYFVFQKIPSELVPKEDKGIVKAKGIPPFGANIDYVQRYMNQADTVFSKAPEVVSRLVMAQAPGESFSINILKPWEDRKRRAQAIVESLALPLDDIIGLDVKAYTPSSSILGSRDDASIEMVVITTSTLKNLNSAVKKVLEILRKVPGIENVYSDTGSLGEAYMVTVDRDKVASSGADVGTIADTLDIFIGGKGITKVKYKEQLYPVRIQLGEEFRKTPDDVSALLVRVLKNRQDFLVPLSELVKIQKESIPIEIFRYMGARGVTITSKLKKGYSMETTLNTIRVQTNAVLPDDASIEFAGESKRFLDESQSLQVIFGLALAFIYLVLAAQYESWRDPLIIMLSVPLSLAGAIYSIKMMGLTMNLYSQIGLVTLIGLITKHGILIVDFANSLKDIRRTRFSAVIEACKMRLRPILMTTFAMVLGAIPLAFAAGAGMETRQPIGWAIVGGMTLGTLFTLIVVPVVYTFLSRKPQDELPFQYRKNAPAEGKAIF